MKQLIMKINTTVNPNIFEFATQQDADTFFEIVDIGFPACWQAWDYVEDAGYTMVARRDDNMLVWEKPDTDAERLELLLQKHDWYYMFSDDNRVYRAGEKQSDDIKDLVLKLGDEGQALYKKYKKG